MFHPGVRLVRIQSGIHSRGISQRQFANRLRRGKYDARGYGWQLRRNAVHVDALRQAGRFHDRQRSARRSLVAITAPSGFVNTVGAVIIGLIAGVLVCLSVEFVEKVMKVDDPVGAISVHGTNGLWGVISVGLFADGKSNYGGSWGGVTGNVTGLFYGDSGQLVAQLIGVSTLIGFVFTFAFVINFAIDLVVGQRVGAKAELEGLDLPEMGALCYPEFELKAHSAGAA